MIKRRFVGKTFGSVKVTSEDSIDVDSSYLCERLKNGKASKFEQYTAGLIIRNFLEHKEMEVDEN